MNTDERLKNKLKYLKPDKRLIVKPKTKASKIQQEQSSFGHGIILGDILDTGMIGGLDLDITTPF